MSKIKRAAQYYVQNEIKGMIDHDIDVSDMEAAFIAGVDWQKKKVIATGKVIKAGQRYMFGEIKHLGERRHEVRFGLHIWRIGLYLFAREYLKYNQYFIVPGVSVDAVNGYDRYLDIEAKILFVGFGIRFIWIKRKAKQ